MTTEECIHETRIPVKVINAAGSVGVTLQCQRCGQCTQLQPTKDYMLDSLPMKDVDLIQRWEAMQQQQRRETSARKIAEIQATYDPALRPWLTPEYKSYIHSSEWSMLRNRVLWRDQYRCQLCWTKVEVTTASIHHLSYDTFSLIHESLPQECVTLCRSCHERIESAKDAARQAAMRP